MFFFRFYKLISVYKNFIIIKLNEESFNLRNFRFREYLFLDDFLCLINCDVF